MGTPGLAEKSSISLLSRMPVPDATMPDPKLVLSVYVTLTTLPWPSATVYCVVWLLSYGCGRPGLICEDGVACAMSIRPASSFA